MKIFWSKLAFSLGYLGELVAFLYTFKVVLGSHSNLYSWYAGITLAVCWAVLTAIHIKYIVWEYLHRIGENA